MADGQATPLLFNSSCTTPCCHIDHFHCDIGLRKRSLLMICLCYVQTVLQVEMTEVKPKYLSLLLSLLSRVLSVNDHFNIVQVIALFLARIMISYWHHAVCLSVCLSVCDAVLVPYEQAEFETPCCHLKSHLFSLSFPAV